MKKVLCGLLILFVLIVGFSGGFQRLFRLVAPEPIDSSGYSPWFEQGLGHYLPDPTDVLKRLMSDDGHVSNKDDFFWTDIKPIAGEITKEELQAYIDACQKCGFSKLKEQVGGVYEYEDVLRGRTVRLHYSATGIMVTAKSK